MFKQSEQTKPVKGGGKSDLVNAKDSQEGGIGIFAGGVKAVISPKPPDMPQEKASKKAGNRGWNKRARLSETRFPAGFDQI